MPQIDVPFLPGDKVRVKATGRIIEVAVYGFPGRGWRIFDSLGAAFDADELEAVKPVIEWKRSPMGPCWIGSRWFAYDNGDLFYGPQKVGTFPDPRAVAEETQTLWNERAVSNEREGK